MGSSPKQMQLQWGISLTKKSVAIASALACLVLLGGCDKPEETDQDVQNNDPTPVAQEVQLKPAVDVSNQTVTIGGKDDAEQISYGGDSVALPDGWPDFLEVYQDSKLINSQRINKAGGIFLSIGLETQDPIESPMAFYEGLLLKQGYKLVQTIEVERHLQRKFSTSKRVVEILCNKEKLRTVVYVNTWPALGS